MIKPRLACLATAISISVAVLLSSPTKIVFVNGEEAGCDLKCPTDAPCTFGNTDFSNHPLNDQGSPIVIGDTNEGHHIDGMHCDCPMGWTGVQCTHKFDTCDDQHQCYHGGKCIPGLKDMFGNTQLFCDCSEAYGSDGTRYGGKYCETPFLNSCGTNNNNGKENFCVNGGDCNPSFPNYGPPCLCSDTYEGEHCEFRKGTVPECNLDCENGGHCVVGINDPDDADILYNLWGTGTTTSDETTLEQYMRCVCPTGYGGRNCEAPISDEGETCGNYHCLNGGKCVESTFTSAAVGGGSVETTYNCDCTNAGADTGDKYSGRMCQYKATEYCTDGGEDSDSKNLEDGIYGTLFCVNNGRCPSNPSLPCECSDEFSGFKCDYRIAHPKPKEPEPIECGEYICYNGGTCVDSEHVTADGTTLISKKMCDCSSAMTANALFAGTNCQYESTNICADPDPSAESLEGVFFCTNHGTCKENAVEGCNCPHGFTGDKCQFSTTQEDDDHFTGAVDCGGDGLACYHGGQCVETTFFLEDGGNRTDYTCDCSSAYDEDHLYSGSSCQYKSTKLCTEPTDDDESLQGHLFCTNNGECKANPRHGCDCPKGFTGFRCEYETTLDVDEDDDKNNDGVADDETHQTLPCAGSVCHNGGTCVAEGEEEHCDCYMAYTDLNKFGGPLCQYKHTSVCGDDNDLTDLKGVPVCFNHGECAGNPDDDCVCQTGWTGPRCEYEVGDDALAEQDGDDDSIDECGDFYCINGGSCVMVMEASADYEKEYHCDCSTAASGTDLFAGSACEHKSTTFCTQPAEGAPTPEGAMFCVNGGTCKDNPYEGCECSSAWTGFHCEFPVDSVAGDDYDDAVEVDQFDLCGDRICYYGGTCNTYTLNGKEETECDCSTATTETSAYAGDSCEFKATQFCGEPDPETGIDGLFFCVNGGECNDNDPFSGCNCPTGYEGLKCDFPLFGAENLRPALPDDRECILQCQNGGTCAKGAKDLGSLETIVENVDHLNKTHSEQFYEHCVCPDGWVGLACDTKVEICGEGEHLCLHGGICVSNDDSNGCDCAEADAQIGDREQTLFAGDFCEHPSTDICSIGEPYPGQPMYFCVNRGICKDKVDASGAHPGCDCPADWEGHDCSIRRRHESMVLLNGRVVVFMVVAAIFMVSGLLVVAFCIRVDQDEKDESTQCMPFRRRRRRSYMNPDDKVNIAALKGSEYGDAPYSNVPPSNRDPMVGLVPPTEDGGDSSSSSESQSYGDSSDDDGEDEPIVHIPERDEDNWPLSDVKIV